MLWFDYYWHKVLKRPYTLSRRIDKGKGQPVVFLHGIASTGENWRQISEKLDHKHHRIIVFDLLGFGDSPQPDWLEYSVEDHAKAVIASLRRMRIRRPIVLVGHSMGGLVAAHIAEKYPKKVRHLILYQMPVYADISKFKTKNFKRQAYLSVFRYLAEHPRLTLWYAKVLGRSASKLVGFVLDERTWQPFELSLRNTIIQQKSYQNLRALKMPTDVVYGRYDIFVIKKNLQNYFRPTKYLRFYEINDLHRVSKRSIDLLYQLIIEDPRAHDRQIETKHARLVNMQKISELENKPKKARSSKLSYGIAATLAAISIAVMSVMVWGGNIPALERSVYLWLNNWNAPVGIEILARVASDIVWAAVFAVALAMLIRKYFWGAYRVAVPAVATYSVVFVTEFLIGRARPDVLMPDETIQRASQDGMGFPSGHMATITVIMIVLWPYLTKPLRIAAVVLVLLVGWSRVFMGVHFPLDIIGGFAFAVLVFSLLRLLPGVMRKRFRLDA